MADEYLLLYPPDKVHGVLAILAPRGREKTIARIEGDGKKGKLTRLRVRALLSDQVPLAGDLQTLLTRPCFHLLHVNENPLTIYLHHGGENAFFFDLFPGKNQRVSFVEVEVETAVPRFAFLSARTVIGWLLDSIMRTTWMPLAIARLDLHRVSDGALLCHELFMPMDEEIRMGPLGGFHQAPMLSAYESLIREAVTTTSPYYRLLCAYRLYEGINPLRKWLRETAEELKVEEKLPRAVEVDMDLVRRMGFSERFLTGLGSSEDVFRKMQRHRNGVAHFLEKVDAAPVDMSNGMAYSDYSLCGALLLHYARASYRELAMYFSRHLSFHFQRGSVLPLKQQRERYVLRPDRHWLARFQGDEAESNSSAPGEATSE